MIIDLDRLSGNGDVVSGDQAFAFQDFQGEETQINYHVKVTVHKSGETYYLAVDLKGAFDTFCHRCLGAVNYKLATSFNLIVNKSNLEKGKDFASEDDGCIYLPAGEHEVELDPQIQENMILSIPMRILCSENCKGLCQQCGANLNVEACNCELQPDSRWDALKKLKDEFPAE
jgi:uncharacterized protein